MVVQTRQRTKSIRTEPTGYLLMAVDGERVWFTPRQHEVLQLLCLHQYTNQQLADHLGITLRTAKNYVGTVLEKMAARNRAEAIIHLIRTNQM